MNTLELLSSLEGCKVVKREDGVIEIIPKVEAKEAPRFKDGDFLYRDRMISILSHYHDDEAFKHVTLMLDGNSLHYGLYTDKNSVKDHRHATEEEKQLLLEALHKERKIWNPETLQIEEDRAPRFGDKCVFWDDGDIERECVFVSKHCGHIKGDKYKHRSENYKYQHCVRIQDYDFETMSPKHEK